MRVIAALLIGLLAAGCCLAQDTDTRLNLCPNPGAEAAADERPAGWLGSAGVSEWATDAFHSGERSLKLAAEAEGTWSWTSDAFALDDDQRELAVSLWAKLDGVTGGGGAMLVLYHCDAQGERTGGSGVLSMGGGGDALATTDWRQHVAFATIPPDVPTIRVNIRLNAASGTAWFDDVEVFPYAQEPLSRPRPLRRGVRLEGPRPVGVVSAEGADEPAAMIRDALEQLGFEVEIIAHDEADLMAGDRDLIILGNLATSEAIEQLYVNYYTYEDLYYPGASGYVLRPLVNPLGSGANILVVGASDDAGLAAGVGALVRALPEQGSTLAVPLTVEIGEVWTSNRFYPWPGPGPYRAMQPAGEYLKTGSLEAAEEYKRYVFDNWFTETDESYADRQNTLHLIYHSRTMSWDLMDSCPVFTDKERLRIDNELLRLMRSNQAYGYAGLSGARYPRGNHDIRNARSFYFGDRHFRKYYAQQLAPEMVAWMNKQRDFWGLIFSSWRTSDEALSQHAVGGSHNCMLDVAFMEPEWAREFFANDYDRMMGDRAIATCNNVAQMVMLGDTNPTDYPNAIFAKLAWRNRDGRYQYMIEKRGMTRCTGDEAMRAFAVGVEPEVPRDHIGLRVLPIDELYFRILRDPAGVDETNGFDKLTFREGFDESDEYMLVDGVSDGGHAYDDANSIGEFSAHGRRWLIEFDRFNGPSMAFHNAVTVARDGLGEAEPPGAAEMLHSASGEGWALTQTRLNGHNGTDWTRHIAWLPGDYTFVLDELAAREPGDYSFVLGWRSVGAPQLRPGVLTCAQDDPEPELIVFDGKALTEAVTRTGGETLYHDALRGAMYYGAERVGDFVEMVLELPRAGQFDVLLTPYRHPTRGETALSIDGEAVGAPVSLAGDDNPEEPPVSVGGVELAAGEHTVRLEVAGPNPEGDSYLVAVRRLAFRAGEPTEADLLAARNRFALCFPPEITATLDRDTEVLGPGLPESPFRDQAINILEQSIGREMSLGDSVCFQSAFAAMAGGEVEEMALRRLSDRAALVRRGDRIELIAVGLEETLTLGDLRVQGRLARIGPDKVLLHEATATLAGEALASGDAPGGVRGLLERTWDEAQPQVAAADGPWADLRQMQTAWSADIEWRPLTVEPFGGRVAAGLEDGSVLVVRDGTVEGEFATGGPVHALEAADLDGDGTLELLVGSDDEHVYALNGDLTERWRTKLPFHATTALFWTLYASKVRALLVDDLDGDGEVEIYAGAGDKHVHALNADGEEQWATETPHGVPATLRTGEPFGDGRRMLLAGNGLTSYAGHCWAMAPGGSIEGTWRNAPKGSAVKDAAAADLDGDGQRTVFCGTVNGDLYAWPPQEKFPNYRWIRNFTRPVRTLTVLPTEPGLLAVGADSGYLAAFDEAGEIMWGVSLTGAVTHTMLVRREGETLLAAGCKGGRVFLVGLDGTPRASFDAGAPLVSMRAADLDGDGGDEIVLATERPGRVVVLR